MSSSRAKRRQRAVCYGYWVEADPLVPILARGTVRSYAIRAASWRIPTNPNCGASAENTRSDLILARDTMVVGQNGSSGVANAMPIAMGILCERCRTVYFIPPSRKSARIHFDRVRGEFKLACDPPCNAVIFFQKRSMLKPFSVTPEAVERGYAQLGECQPLTQTKPAAKT